MIIKSHVRGGLRQAATYLKDQGENEKVRLVEISDIAAQNLNEAFYNMWAITARSKVKKPLHHISINPYKDERLTDTQVLAIIERCEQKYGYQPGCHSRVIVEHIKDGRQHFHVMWCRVSLTTRKAVWPGHHWKKSKQVAREMEVELGLKRPAPKRGKRLKATILRTGRQAKIGKRYQTLAQTGQRTSQTIRAKQAPTASPAAKMLFELAMRLTTKRRNKQKNENRPTRQLNKRSEWASAELLAWAWANGRTDILAQFGINLPPDFEF